MLFWYVAECLIAPPRYPDIATVTTCPLPLPPVYPSTAFPRPYPLFAPSRSAIQLLTGGVATETTTGGILVFMSSVFFYNLFKFRLQFFLRFLIGPFSMFAIG